jgi:hypothetical protein
MGLLNPQGEEVDAWANVAQNTMRVGATKNLTANYNSMLYIDCALTSGTAHTGTELIVQISSNVSGYDFWTDLTPVIGPLGTPNPENMSCGAGDTTIGIANTSNFVTPGWRFIQDGTIGDSEFVYQDAYTSNSSITVVGGAARAHAANTTMYNIGDTIPVELPFSTNRVRVLYNNRYDADGSSVATRCRLTKVTRL